MTTDVGRRAHAAPTPARRRSIYDVPIRDLPPAAAAALGVRPRPCEECARLAGVLLAVQSAVDELRIERDTYRGDLVAARADLARVTVERDDARSEVLRLRANL